MNTKLLGVLTAAAMTAGATLAMASDATGTVKSIDAATHTVMLDSGAKFVPASGVDFSKLKVGEKVKLTYSVANGHNTVSSWTAM